MKGKKKPGPRTIDGFIQNQMVFKGYELMNHSVPGWCPEMFNSEKEALTYRNRHYMPNVQRDDKFTVRPVYE